MNARQEIRAYLERVDPAYIAASRASNQRFARWYLVPSVIAACAPAGCCAWGVHNALGGSPLWWSAYAVFMGAIASAFVRFFIVREILYTLKTGDFR